MKVDLKKELGTYTARRGRFDVVTVPPLRYLMVDGHGDPNTAEQYRDALQTIYPFAYALKFLSKRTLDRDYTVMPLEALWWADDMAAFTSARDKSQWSWTLLNLVPEWITAEHLATARDSVSRKGAAPLLDSLRVETLDEGLCVQTLHVGSYDDEAPVLDALHNSFVPEAGLVMTGRHHEIYLSDARRTAPEKLRTILRQPVARASAAGA
ncbi:GyrI-like domain-containing protein [Leifsonia sp. 2MCAF36]|uniref:GyrI-like domain-containing protein n=1 Tax=Leifsonia sp. 2MCAF36 TaxID=3232988 RepID=UPI003F9A1F77